MCKNAHFRFMDLPLEIRFDIYEHTLKSPFLIFKQPDEQEPVKRTGLCIMTADLTDSFNPVLMRVSKQVQTEYSSFAYSKAKLRVWCYYLQKTGDFQGSWEVVHGLPNAIRSKVKNLVLTYIDVDNDWTPEDCGSGMDKIMEMMESVVQVTFVSIVVVGVVENKDRVHPRQAIENFRHAQLCVTQCQNRLKEYATSSGRQITTDQAVSLLICPLYTLNPQVFEQEPKLYPDMSPAPGLPPWDLLLYQVRDPYLHSDLEDAIAWHGFTMKSPYLPNLVPFGN